MVMNRQGAAPANPLAMTAAAPPAGDPTPPAPTRANLKGTMIGIAPPTFTPPAATPAPAMPAAGPPGASPPATAAPAPQQRAFSGTMIGLAPPSAPPPPPPSPETPPAAPAPTPGGAPRLASANKTVLGVARPGIAPLNPGQAKSTPPPAAVVSKTVPSWPPPLLAPVAEAPASSGRKPARRVSVAATIAIVACAMLLVMAAMAFVMLRGRGSVSARAGLDAKGREVLELSCAECPDDTKIWIDAAPVRFRGGKAALPLRAPLKVGENPLLIVLERPGRSREEIALSIPIEFRVRGSTDELSQEIPKVSVLASTLEGTKLEVDGKPVPAGPGDLRFDYEVTSELTGPEASVKTLERTVPYKATSASGSVQAGQVEIRIGVTPLIVDAPGASIIVGGKEIVIAGRTAPGAVLKVGNETVPLDPEGRFVRKQALRVGENKLLVRATLKDLAPRLVQVSVRCSDNLEREAALQRAMAQASYADVLRAGDAATGRSVALEGQLQDLRHDGYSSVLLVDVKKGCAKAPCLAKVIYGVETQLEKGRDLKAFGKVLRFVDGPRTGQRIPEVRADLVTAGVP